MDPNTESEEKVKFIDKMTGGGVDSTYSPIKTFFRIFDTLWELEQRVRKLEKQ